MKKFELGIYGGTFGPIHNGHVNAARCFYDQLDLDKLLIMPTFLPPHKEKPENDDPNDRLAMAKLAFYGDKRNIEVSDYEINKGGKSYTYLTLQNFSANDTEITFLCGTDMFLSLEEWKEPEIIFSLCRIALIRREKLSPSTEAEIEKAMLRYKEKFSARLCEIVTDSIEISSTDIRRMVSEGKDISLLVPEGVCEYIHSKGLYLKK